MEKKQIRPYRWLKEPLVHFLLLGSALFLVFHLMGDPETRNPDKIVVTEGRIDNLVENFRRRWLRPPSQRELKGLVEEYIKEEVLYREALAMGLDKNDTVIRRRLRQKMQFLFEDVAARVEPTEEELRAYLEKNSAFFRIESHFTFTHVYLNPDRHGASLRAVADDLLETLNQAPDAVDAEALGDSIMLSREYGDVALTDVKKLFGEGFARALTGLGTGRWEGPVESGYGIHFVRVRHRVEGRDPALEEVRDIVEREFRNVRRKEVNEAAYRRLLERYTVVMEPVRTPGAAARAEEKP